MATISLVAGNTAPNLLASLTNAAGAQDLTGAVVVARLTDQDSGTVETLDCTLVSPETGGQVTVEAPAAEDGGWPAGDWVVEYDVTFAGGALQTFPLKAEDRDLLLIRTPSAAA